MIEPVTVAGVRVTLGGVSVGFAAGGDAKAGGRTLVAAREDRVALART